MTSNLSGQHFFNRPPVSRNNKSNNRRIQIPIPKSKQIPTLIPKSKFLPKPKSHKQATKKLEANIRLLKTNGNKFEEEEEKRVLLRYLLISA